MGEKIGFEAEIGVGWAYRHSLEVDGEPRNVDDHDHGEVLFEHALRNFGDVGACLGALGADLGNNSLGILSYNRNNCFHIYPSFPDPNPPFSEDREKLDSIL